MLPTLPIGSLFLSELIGKEIISDTYHGINSTLSQIESFDIRHVNNCLEKLDILKKIEIINSIFENYQCEGNKTKIMSLNNLHEIADKIKMELEEIKKDLEYSKTIYFSYLRSQPYFEKLKKLNLHCDILDQRLKLFLLLQDS